MVALAAANFPWSKDLFGSTFLARTVNREPLAKPRTKIKLIPKEGGDLDIASYEHMAL